jgi:hypothetical protein
MATDAERVQELEATLKDVLQQIRPQGHISWELNTCTVTNQQLADWWSVLGVKATWTERAKG